MFEETRKLNNISDIENVDTVTGMHMKTEYASAVHVDSEDDVDIVGEIEESIRKETSTYDNKRYGDCYSHNNNSEAGSCPKHELKHVEDLFVELNKIVTSAKSILLSTNKCVINRDQATNLIDQIVTLMPSELRDARIIVESRNELIHQARRAAEKTVTSAQSKADEIYLSAKRDAELTLTSANSDANSTRVEAKEEAAVIIAKAKEDAQAMVEKEAVFQDAQSQANEMIEDAKKKAQDILNEAQQQAKAMLNSTEKQCNDLMTKTNAKVEELQRVSNQYMEDSLRKTEEAIEASLRSVKTTRTKFQSITGATLNALPMPNASTDQTRHRPRQKNFFIDI